MVPMEIIEGLDQGNIDNAIITSPNRLIEEGGLDLLGLLELIM